MDVQLSSSSSLGSLTNDDDDDGSEDVAKKIAFFQSLSRLFGPALYVKSWIHKDFIQVQKEKGEFVFVCPRPP